jgi:SPP1 family predicted phage head-tail adaptor
MAVNRQAGNLRQRIRFERLGVPISDGAGNQVKPWESLCERYAEVKGVPVTNASAESIIQGRLTGTAFMTIVVRHDAKTRQLSSDDRAVSIADGTIFNIRSALDLDGDRRWITIDAQRGVAT